MAKNAADRKSDMVMLFEIKNQIERSSLKARGSYDPVSMDSIHSKIEDLNSKIEELRDVVIGVRKHGDSPRKIKLRKDILDLIQKHKKLNPAQLAQLIKLSRVRANEYLRELEAEKLVRGVVVKKKKFYMLASDIVGHREEEQPAA